MWVEQGVEKRELFLELLDFPRKHLLLTALREISEQEHIYVVGGALRDLFYQKKILDLDLAVKENPEKVAEYLAKKTGYSLVLLSEEFGIYRLSKDRHTVDITEYRGQSLEEDLAKRDFTINSIALPLRALFEGPFLLYDPIGGLKDLSLRQIRTYREENLIEDPLRILRGYRLYAQGYGDITNQTRAYFRRYKGFIIHVAPERLSMELKFILLTTQASLAFRLMDEDGVLEELFPEIKPSRGMPQPSFHHLDVLSHNLTTLEAGEKILNNPKHYLSLQEAPSLFEEEDFVLTVKLACFFHDLGKGYTFAESGERITFYGHEREGAKLWESRALSLRFKTEIIERVARLIRNHMRPCLLLKEWEEGKLSLRAKRNLIKDQPNFYELWIVSLADSLASKGPDKEPDYEEKLNKFFHELLQFQRDLERVEKRERILTGKDLIQLGFKPGPLFKTILEDVELKVLEGEIRDRESALAYVLENYRTYL
ncbi:MAG: HD domain-containing protein [Caldimicrobium sp.]|nr:HD domain-containing protein [Caldimicrobium sp.]MCX7873472.1 HD domain-containing protein [Caldimicrobium sp.]MDW8094935.1 HD domain-containing protein [Caldimicrobium sp.]